MDIEAFFRQLDGLFAARQLETVEPFLQQSLQLAQQQGDLAAQVSVYNEIVGYERSIGRHREAVEAAWSALQLLTKMGLSDSIHAATTYLNGATAYRMAGKQEEALEWYMQALRIYKRELPEHDYRMASLYNNISSLYQEMGEIKSALFCLEEALGIISRIPDTEIEQAITHTNLALAYLKAGQSEEAYRHIRAALQIFEERPGERDIHYSAALAALAQYYSSKKQYPDAIAVYEKARAETALIYGKTQYYTVMSENLALVYEEMGDTRMAELIRQQAAEARSNWEETAETDGRQLSGMELSRRYYETVGKPMIHQKFPEYEQRIAVGLVGYGSECYGFDDDLSKDHDFGPGFCMWLTKEDYAEIGTALQQAYEALPKTFLGVPARKTTAYGTGRVGVREIESFYCELMETEEMPGTIGGWMALSEPGLSAAVNGAVFRDDFGLFTRIRTELQKGFPAQVKLRKLAQNIALMAQAGQYNYSRCLAREDTVAAAMALYTFMDAAMSAVYLLNNAYAPFYKWKHRQMKELPKLSEISTEIEKLADSKTAASAKAEIIERICRQVLDEMKAQGMTEGDETFLEVHAQRILHQ